MAELDPRTLRAAAKRLRRDGNWWAAHSAAEGASACLYNARRFEKEARAIERKRNSGRRAR